MATIFVTGVNGQVGRELRDLAASFPLHTFSFADRSDVDITNVNSIESAFSALNPRFCINCAAYTAVDKAETEKERAFAVNANAVRNLATVCNKYSTRFIHLSTDYVFDGTAGRPYKEDDPTHPINVYGESKRQGELEAQKANPEAILLRTSWVYSSYGNNFVKTMLRLMQSRHEINVVADQHGSPTYAADLAGAIMYIIESGTWIPGIYHYTNEGTISWYQFAEAIKELAGLSCTVHPITTEQYLTPARRPRYSVLEKEKIKKTFGLQLWPWQQSLQRCLARLKVLPAQ